MYMSTSQVCRAIAWLVQSYKETYVMTMIPLERRYTPTTILDARRDYIVRGLVERGTWRG
jgi:hypothetical protein